jgi:hypothetical protein
MQSTATPDNALRIAIVGGGIAGLATAYYLMARARTTGAALDIALFEGKRTLGGNADTVVVDLGLYTKRGGGSERYHRWADLGVNDANLSAYTLMQDVMRDIGYLANMKPLQDSTCYHAPGSSFAWTDDAAVVDGVSDPRFSLADADGGRLQPLIAVVHAAALDLLDQVATDYTCSRYFQDCIDDPFGMLGAAAHRLGIGIDWSARDLGTLLEQVRDKYYYPRISAMYFTDPSGPGVMPLQAPFEYYRLQEGGSGGPQPEAPQRCYFDRGAQTWLDALAAHLEGRSDARVSVTIHTGAMAQVDVAATGVTVRHNDATLRADVCVMANHADDAARALAFHDSVAAYGSRVHAILGAVRYTYGYAVCHTFAGQMPANRNTWRTYNIPLRSDGDSRFPYRIDYVANLHQNDPANPFYDRAGLPVYFVSLVDDLNRIPRQDMLDRVTDPEAMPATWREGLPGNVLDALRGRPLAETGYRHQVAAPAPALDTKAWTAFKHNILDARCIQAQAEINALNREWARQHRAGSAGAGAALPALLFGGGWTIGAGLHEQCLQQAQAISLMILPEQG